MTPDIETLIFTAYHGELTDAQRDALSQWVTESPANARVLMEYAIETRGLEITLHSDQAAQAADTIGSTGKVFQDEETKVAEPSPEADHLHHPLGETSQSSGWDKRSVFAVAALIGIAATIGLVVWFDGMRSTPNQDVADKNTPGPVAPFAEERPDNAEPTPWVTAAYDSDSIQFTNVDSGNKDQIGNMPFGFSAYSFWRQGTVIVQGPAQWQMLDENAIRLFDGLLVARSAEDPLKPLSFFIDQTEIRVRAGEFGVVRTGADTASIIVFAGSVELLLHSGGEYAPVQTLEAGQIGVLKTRLGTVLNRASATQQDKLRFSDATGRLRYRPLQTTRSVFYRYKTPKSLVYGDHDYPQFIGHASLIGESRGVAVAQGEFDKLKRDRPGLVTISADQAVDSYLLHFDPTGGDGLVDPIVKGMIAFDRPILVVLDSSDAVLETDSKYGLPDIAYPRSDETAGGQAGSRSWGIELAQDNITLSQDRKRLYFELQAESDIDQFRILVEAR